MKYRQNLFDKIYLVYLLAKTRVRKRTRDVGVPSALPWSFTVYLFLRLAPLITLHSTVVYGKVRRPADVRSSSEVRQAAIGGHGQSYGSRAANARGEMRRGANRRRGKKQGCYKLCHGFIS
jgi:hypothetical protein